MSLGSDSAGRRARRWREQRDRMRRLRAEVEVDARDRWIEQQQQHGT